MHSANRGETGYPVEIPGQIEEQQQTQPQMMPIEGLTDDWSRIVTEDEKQLQTVGHHTSRSRPFNDEERARLARDGVCLACHQEIPDKSLAVNLLPHVAEYTGQPPETRDQHNSLRPDILTCHVRCSCVCQNADRENPAFRRTQLQLLAEISVIIMTQANVLKTLFFRQIDTSCQDVWRHKILLVSGWGQVSG